MANLLLYKFLQPGRPADSFLREQPGTPVPPYCLRQQGPTPADGPQRNYRPTGQSSSSFWKPDGGEFSEQIPAKWGPDAKRWGKDFPRPGEDGSARKGSTGGSGLICEEKLPDGLPILYNNRFAIFFPAWYNNKIK